MATVVPCPECAVPQTIVTGTRALRTHNRIGLSTGIDYGRCLGSGSAYLANGLPTAQPPPVGPDAPPQAPTHSYSCRVCGAKTRASLDGLVTRHTWPESDALCRASDSTKEWVPKNTDAGRPRFVASTGATLSLQERKLYKPLVHQVLLDNGTTASGKEAKFRAEDKRLRARKAAERKWMKENGIRVFSGGAPGLGKRR